MQQDAIKAEFFGIAELLKAEGHAVVARSGFWTIGAEESVPEREVESEVTVLYRGKIIFTTIFSGIDSCRKNQTADW